MIKTYTVRLLPDEKQEAQFWQHIDCCRFIWNYMIELQQKRYASGEKHLSAYQMMNELTRLKKDGQHDWLYNVSNASLQIICQDLDKAYKRFFSKIANYPKFKSRKNPKKSFPVKCEMGYFYFKNNKAQIQKIGKVPYQTNYMLPQGTKAKFSNPRILFKHGKWLLIFGMECENQAPILSDKAMGIDLGVKVTAVVSFGDKKIVYKNINKTPRVRMLKRKLKHVQRVISRKNRTNGNYDKTAGVKKYERIQAAIYARLANIRKDYVHKMTCALVNMLPGVVAMEDLNIKGLLKNKHLSEAIIEQCWFMIIRQMRYKCENKGIEFIQVDRFFPSSKTCSACGSIKRDLKLSNRVFICPECGFECDRDYNAAKNLAQYADYIKQAAS